MRPDPTFRDVPVIMDYAHDERQRQILRLAFTAQLWGRPYVAPPDLPPERARALRGAFQATMRDPAFLAEAKKMSFDIGPLSGEKMAGLIAGLYASPADIIQANARGVSRRQEMGASRKAHLDSKTRKSRMVETDEIYGHRARIGYLADQRFRPRVHLSPPKHQPMRRREPLSPGRHGSTRKR
jgi:hypothetical protein